MTLRKKGEHKESRTMEIAAYYMSHGMEQTCYDLGLRQTTVERELRRAKKHGINVKKSTVLQKISELYTDKELTAIASGARIIPGQSKIPVVNLKGDRTRIGVMGDIHFGSKYCLYGLVNKAFKEFEKEKVDIVCQVGDLTEGMSNRPGHIYQQSKNLYEMIIFYLSSMQFVFGKLLYYNNVYACQTNMHICVRDQKTLHLAFDHQLNFLRFFVFYMILHNYYHLLRAIILKLLNLLMLNYLHHVLKMLRPQDYHIYLVLSLLHLI